MCGISGIEFLVIIVAAIIILGPEKLPDAMRAAGKLAREVRKIRGDLGDVTKEIRSQVNVSDLQKQLVKELDIDRARERMKDAESEIDAIRSRLNKDLKAPAGELIDEVTSAPKVPQKGPSPESMGLVPTSAGEKAAAAASSPAASLLPQIRPAQGTFSRDEDPNAEPETGVAEASEGGTPDEGATPSVPLRVRSTAKGAPTPPEPLQAPSVESPEPKPDDTTPEAGG